MKTSTQKTRETLKQFYNNDFTELDRETAAHYFQLYIRHDSKLYNHIYNEKRSDNFKKWDVILTTLNNQMEELGEYYATADQVRRITKDKGAALLEAAGEMLKQEEGII